MLRSLPVALLILFAAEAVGQKRPPAKKAAKRPNPTGMIPPPGIAVPPDVQATLTKKLAALDGELARLPLDEKTERLRPDVEIFARGVRLALDLNGFFDPKDFQAAESQLDEGLARCKSLAKGAAPWTTQKGLVVRGYRSKLDGSVQPYGLIVPDNFDPAGEKKHRMDVWLHGRGDTMLEVQFIEQRRKQKGEFAPAGAFVLHPFGRYCNAFRFAGEVDVFEAMDHVKANYRIDDNRLGIRGFSMGGAGCWSLATRHPGVWAAAAPGAGFSETEQYLGIGKTRPEPPWFERKLWNMYDSTVHAGNLFNVPTIAYSGEIDKQKQAADVMVAAAKKEGIDLPHLIGPGTAHKYHPDTKKELERRFDALMEKGRAAFPEQIKFTTQSLATSNYRWLVVEGLGRHWEPADVEAKIVGTTLEVATKNIARIGIYIYGRPAVSLASVRIDNQSPNLVGTVFRDTTRNPVTYSQYLKFARDGQTWRGVDDGERQGFVKDRSVQGPIDDAFMSSFVYVQPTGTPLNAVAGAFAERELKHAAKEWRRHFRGDARIKKDSEIGKDDIENNNLILFGDPSSNAVLSKIADKLPMKWTNDTLEVAGRTFPVGTHVPAMIFPNPLNPSKYVVLNSGHTMREGHNSTNALQTPKLPDWAVFDATVPPTPTSAGKLVAAGFFGEKWEPLNDPREVLQP